METYISDRVTISGPAQDIDTIINSFSTELIWKDGTRHTLLLDGAKLLPYPPDIKDSTVDGLGSPRAAWRRQKWGSAWPSTGSDIERIGPTRVTGIISTRIAGPEALYLEVSRRFPRCVIVVQWFSDSGCYENGYCGEEMMVNGRVVHRHHGEPTSLDRLIDEFATEC